MIYVYTGGVGSGKSYHAMVAGLEYCEVLRKSCRRHVVANFPVEFRGWKAKYEDWWIWKDEWTPKELIRMSIEKGWNKREDSALLILDEAAVIFNSRDWQANKERNNWIKFFAHSRKLGYEIILIAQDIRAIDRQIRNMADMEVKHINWKAIPFLGLIPAIIRMPVVWRVYYPLRTKFNGYVTIGIVKPWIAKRYDTMKLFGVSKEALGIQIEEYQTI